MMFLLLLLGWGDKIPMEKCKWGGQKEQEQCNGTSKKSLLKIWYAFREKIQTLDFPVVIRESRIFLRTEVSKTGYHSEA